MRIKIGVNLPELGMFTPVFFIQLSLVPASISCFQENICVKLNFSKLIGQQLHILMHYTLFQTSLS